MIPEEKLIDMLPIYVFYKDTKNNFIKVNKKLANALGYTESDIKNNNFKINLLPKEDTDNYYKDDKIVLETKLPKKGILEKLQTVEGLRWVITDKYPYKNDDNKVVGIIGFSIDVTDSLSGYEKLTTLSKAVEYSPSVVVITNLENKITYVNPKFEQVTGYTSLEVLGKNPKFLYGKTKKVVYDQLWETLHAKLVWTGEFINKTKSGELYWEIANIAPVLNDNEEIIYYIKVSSPLTDLRRTAFNIWNIIDESHNYIVVLDKNMNIIYCNLAIATQLGYTSSNSLIGENWNKHVIEEQIPVINLFHENILNKINMAQEFTYEIVDKDKNIQTIKWFSSLINGNSNLIFNVGIPIKKDIGIDDSIDTIRKYFQSSIDKDKLFIQTIKNKTQASSKQQKN